MDEYLREVGYDAYIIYKLCIIYLVIPCAAVSILSDDDASDACIMSMVVDMETAEWRGVANWHRRGFIYDEFLVESSRIDFVTGRG